MEEQDAGRRGLNVSYTMNSVLFIRIMAKRSLFIVIRPTISMVLIPAFL